jgi:hypothetical protein
MSGWRCSAVVLVAQVLCLGARADEVPPVASVELRSGFEGLLDDVGVAATLRLGRRLELGAGGGGVSDGVRTAGVAGLLARVDLVAAGPWRLQGTSGFPVGNRVVTETYQRSGYGPLGAMLGVGVGAGGPQPGPAPVAYRRASQIGLRLELDPALEVSGNEYFSSRVSSAVGFGVDCLFEFGASWFGPGSHWFGAGARYERAWTGDPSLKDSANEFFVPLLAGVAIPVGGDWLLEARIGLGPTAVVFDHFNVIQTALGGAVEVSLAFGFRITPRTTLLFGPDGRLSLLALPENGSNRKLGGTSLVGLHVDLRLTI